MQEITGKLGPGKTAAQAEALSALMFKSTDWVSQGDIRVLPGASTAVRTMKADTCYRFFQVVSARGDIAALRHYIAHRRYPYGSDQGYRPSHDVFFHYMMRGTLNEFLEQAEERISETKSDWEKHKKAIPLEFKLLGAIYQPIPQISLS